MSSDLAHDGRRVDVEGHNEQTDVEIDVAHWVSLAAHALDAEGVGGDAELSLLFVDETVIAGLNEQYMGEARPTDVLAFPLDEVDQGPSVGSALGVPTLLGDVVVCPAVAARQAPDHGSTLDDELALLVVHGVLHVLGHDHADETETAAMQARERHILDTFGP